MRVWSLGREDPLEKDMATHSNIFAWRVPRAEEPGRLWSIGSYRVGHDWSSLAHVHAPCYRNCGPLGRGIGLHGCTTLGPPSCGGLLKMELLAIATCTNVCVVPWNSIFLHFVLGVLSVLSLLQCVFVYVCISASLSFISPSLLKSLWVQIWEDNRQEGQGSPNGGSSLQVSDIFISLKRQEETN